jgi:hypothetical protein
MQRTDVCSRTRKSQMINELLYDNYVIIERLYCLVRNLKMVSLPDVLLKEATRGLLRVAISRVAASNAVIH